MTRVGHHQTMKQVQISKLKSQLSAYLRDVRKGNTITVLDRDYPIAQVVPFKERAESNDKKNALKDLLVPKPHKKKWKDVKLSGIKAHISTEHIVEIIKELRSDR